MLAKIAEPLRDAGLLSSPVHVIDFNTPRTWHFLTIDPSRPQVITKWLQRANLWVYWPNFTMQRHLRNGRRCPKQVSVLHGYLPLAVHAARPDTWDVVHRTPGVRGFMRDGHGRPAHIRECEIEAIREIEGRLNLAPQQAAYAAYPVGTLVRFIGAKSLTWDGAKVIEVADDGRIRVGVILFNREVPMWVDATEIEAM